MTTTRAMKRHTRRVFVDWALSLLLRRQRCNVEAPILPLRLRKMNGTLTARSRTDCKTIHFWECASGTTSESQKIAPRSCFPQKKIRRWRQRAPPRRRLYPLRAKFVQTTRRLDSADLRICFSSQILFAVAIGRIRHISVRRVPTQSRSSQFCSRVLGASELSRSKEQ